jgi:hypothetical protein
MLLGVLAKLFTLDLSGNDVKKHLLMTSFLDEPVQYGGKIYHPALFASEWSSLRIKE